MKSLFQRFWQFSFNSHKAPKLLKALNKPLCHHCGTRFFKTQLNCQNCGAPLPLTTAPSVTRQLSVLASLLLALGYGAFQLYDAHQLPPPAPLFSNATWFDRFSTKIISVKIIQETEQSLILEVDYNFAESDAGRSQIFVLPDMPYWSQSVAYVQPGRNQVSIVVDLNTDKMKANGVSSVVSSRLSASIARYTETAYLGEITANHIPYKKRWAL